MFNLRKKEKELDDRLARLEQWKKDTDFQKDPPSYVIINIVFDPVTAPTCIRQKVHLPLQWKGMTVHFCKGRLFQIAGEEYILLDMETRLLQRRVLCSFTSSS